MDRFHAKGISGMSVGLWTLWLACFASMFDYLEHISDFAAVCPFGGSFSVAHGSNFLLTLSSCEGAGDDPDHGQGDWR